MSAWRWFFSFYGRIGRGQFIVRLIAVWLVTFTIALAAWGTGESMFFMLPVFIGGFSIWSLIVKRLHDIGGTGWAAVGVTVLGVTVFALDLSLISAIIELCFWLFLTCMPGKAGANRFEAAS